MVMNTAATLTGRGVNVEFLMAAPMSIDPTHSIYTAVIFMDGGNGGYGPLLKRSSTRAANL